jgi:hypothetical protein
MARTTNAGRLAGYERRYRELASGLATIGFIAAGSVAPRFNRCGTPGCRCHGDPPRLHGPYYQCTAKLKGVTVNRRLNEREAERYTEWIGNDRRVRAILAQMREVAARATDLILKEDAAKRS